MCTNFLLAAPVTPGSASPVLYVSARCMELTGILECNIYQVPQAQNFPLVASTLQNPAKWTNQYGFIGIADSSAFSGFPIFVDGINEVGLSCASLWLPGTAYAADVAGSIPNLNFSDFGAWVMGNFSSVTDLVDTLTKTNSPSIAPINVVGPAAGGKFYLPLHFIATDNTGASVVVEFIGGAMNVYPPSYDNGATADGVLTNAPTYDWQRSNLNNYSHLSVVGPQTSTTSVGPPVGGGLLGMPGDPMSASRFVRAATLQQSFGQLPNTGSNWLPAPWNVPKNSSSSNGYAGPVQTIVNVAMQMVQMIQATPYGTALTTPTSGSTPLQVGDWTMWSVVRDHTDVVFYYQSAFNSLMQAIELAQLSFSNPASTQYFPKFQSIALLPPPSSLGWYQDATGSFA